MCDPVFSHSSAHGNDRETLLPLMLAPPAVKFPPQMRGVLHDMQVVDIDRREQDKLLTLEEGHFLDLKSKDVAPGKLTRTLSAFANADGGMLYVGILQDQMTGVAYWDGFGTPEAANGHIQSFEQLFPFGNYVSYQFLRSPIDSTLVLEVDVAKTPNVRHASDGIAYLRRGAQNLPQKSPEQIERLNLNKGIASYETQAVRAPEETIENSLTILNFVMSVVPHTEPRPWLGKQNLILNELPTVAGLLLFCDEPQVFLPHACVKVYQYNTSEPEGSRETLAFDPIAVEQHLYAQIEKAVAKSAEIIEGIPVLDAAGFERISYPKEALHEIITNAVIHRDYSLNDDIHVRIFNNRVEVLSPGTLPGHINAKNILRERASRNSVIVRLLNKFPDPPNKSVGEGLNTAFEAMRRLKLRDPIIEEEGNYVRVTLRHEKLAKPEEIIMEYLSEHEEINNRKAREICHIGSENVVKNIFIRLMESNQIEKIPGRVGSATAYRKKD